MRTISLGVPARAVRVADLIESELPGEMVEREEWAVDHEAQARDLAQCLGRLLELLPLSDAELLYVVGRGEKPS